MTISTAGSVQQERMCIKTRSEQGGTRRKSLTYIAKEWMHMHIQSCFQKKERQPFPLTRTAPHHQSYFPLIGIDKCWDLYHMECVGLERPPSNKSNGIVTIALYSHNNCCICFRPTHLTWIFVIP